MYSDRISHVEHFLIWEGILSENEELEFLCIMIDESVFLILISI